MSEQIVLQSQKYMAGYGQYECACCGRSVSESAEVCAHCFMPVSISLSAAEQGVRPTFIPVLGCSGAGKTVFLGMLLDLLNKGKHGISGQPKTAFSIAVQQETMLALERRRFPKKTPLELEEWNWIHCQVEYQRKRKSVLFDVVAPDIAGEALAMELDMPNSFPVVRNCVSQATGFILVIDARKVCDRPTDEDLMATKIATYINSHLSPNGGRSQDVPIAVTFSKADLCEEVSADPFQFARQNLPGFLAFAEKNLPEMDFFASSVVGSVTNVSDNYGEYFVPLHVQPKGIAEPLAWVLSR